MKKIIFPSFFAAIIILIGFVWNNQLGQTSQTNLASNFSGDSRSNQTANFRGTKGDFVALENKQIILETAAVDDGQTHYFNTLLPNGNFVYFFIVKSPDGEIRAAANGCQVCGKALQGFRQENEFMVCNTCGNRYPLNKIATEKGGCNPAPIDPDLTSENGKIKIPLSKLQDVERFFLS